MKKITQKLSLRTSTVRNLNAVAGGARATTLEPRPRTYGCPDGTAGCLPPKSDGCFTEVSCPTITQ